MQAKGSADCRIQTALFHSNEETYLDLLNIRNMLRDRMVSDNRAHELIDAVIGEVN